MKIRTLREDLKTLIQSWDVELTGVSFDNEYNEGERLGSTVKKLLEEESEDSDLIEGISRQWCFYADTSSKCQDELRQVLMNHGAVVLLRERAVLYLA